ncbi:MAG: tRNA pseudouridine(38-40) synthase TruA [Parvibaculales bacterium]
MTQRYKLLIEYDGTPFCGWQSQSEGCGVQDALSGAFQKFCGEQVTVFGAGRTDTGVHARGQVGHVDLAKDTDAETVKKAVNQHLKPLPVAVLGVEAVTDDFDARFSAIRRHYLYRFLDRRAPLTLERDRACWVPVSLDVEAMHEAAQVFLGRHDFTTFRSVQCQSKSPVKSIEAIRVQRQGAHIDLTVSARSFLHHQIRSFAGALKLVGEGKWQASDVAEALAACERAACAPVAGPEGLYFMQVDYA